MTSHDSAQARGIAVAAEPDSGSAEIACLNAARTDPAAFAPVYQAYFPRIYTYCRRRVNTDQEAEDLTSTIFTRALIGLDGYRGGSVAAWLFRIAHNTIANYHRDHHPTLSLDAHPFDVIDAQPPPVEHVITAEECARVRALVADLPAEAQDIVRLRIDAGLTSEEIGDIIGKRAGAVRMKLHRILKRLGTQLNDEDAS